MWCGSRVVGTDMSMSTYPRAHDGNNETCTDSGLCKTILRQDSNATIPVLDSGAFDLFIRARPRRAATWLMLVQNAELSGLDHTGPRYPGMHVQILVVTNRCSVAQDTIFSVHIADRRPQ